MSKYRIVHKKVCLSDTYYDDKYYAQYKLWGLFWVNITADCWWESNARRAIENHKLEMKMKKQCKKTTIIEVE